jgi:HTH-type transcriptional regulator/antitoxin HigA
MSHRTVSTDAELDQALFEIEGFFEAPPVPGSNEADVFDSLTDAIADFEDKAYPTTDPK